MRNYVLFTLAMLPMISARLLERCFDDYGCAACAGYTWCDETQTCMRWWEEDCDIDLNMTYLISDNGI